ncbi:MAG: transglycosylase SLT domain-containing protein [Sphingomonadales bacterium]
MTISNSVTGTTEPRIRAAIAQAASRTGVDFDYLYNQARIESSLDPEARARTSSAAGLYQFTKQTWLQVVKAHGADHGLGWAAEAIDKSGSGYQVADPSMRTAIDNLRYDPELASTMAGEFASDNRDKLESSLGRTAEPVDLYLAHFMGAKGASDFLSAYDADPSMAAAPLFTAAAAANHSIFYAPDGSARSLGEIRSNFATKLGGSAPAAPQMATVTWTQQRRNVAEATDRAPLQMASIEPMPQTLSVDYARRAYNRLAGLGQ